MSVSTPALSRKIQSLQGGAETSFTRMLRLANQTPNLISLGRGDPDVATPAHIVEAAVKVLQTGHVNYTPPPGMPALREAIAEKLRRENGLHYEPLSEILVTCGAQEAISVIMQTLLDPGDEVLLPDPFYTAYEMAIGLAHGKVVHVPTYAEQDFEVQPAEIAARISERTRMIVLVSPSNPTGGVISAAALEEIAAIAIRHNLIVVSDELYEKVLFDGAQAQSIARLQGMRERTIIINGFSKTYCMTGFRVGYLAGPAALMTALQEPHHIFTICAPTASQHAALAALRGDQACVTEIVGIFAGAPARLVGWFARCRHPLSASIRRVLCLWRHPRHRHDLSRFCRKSIAGGWCAGLPRHAVRAMWRRFFAYLLPGRDSRHRTRCQRVGTRLSSCSAE